MAMGGLRLCSVRMRNFRTFKGKQTWELPKGPGLYLMRGVNHADKRLAGNDVGKSTLWDAVFWGLYGVTTRGLRASNVVSWGTSSARVEQDWILPNGRHVTITRRQSPNKLYVDRKAATQEEVTELVGLGPEEFLHGVLVGQFTSYFLDLSPADKLGLFGSVLELDFWKQRVMDARSAVMKVTELLTGLNLELEGEKVKISVHRNQHIKLRKKSKAWAADAAKQSNTYRYARDRLRKQIKGLEKTIRILDRKKKDAGELAKQLEEKHLLAESNVLDLRKRVGNANQDIRQVSCPFCKRRLDKSWRDGLRKKLKGMEKDLEEKQALEKNLRRQLDDAARKETEAFRRVDEKRRLLESLRLDLHKAEIRLDQLDRKTNPYQPLLEAEVTNLADAKRRAERLQRRIDRAEAKRSRLKFWIDGFRDVRLWVLENSLSELELRVNNSLVQLGLPDWEMRLAVERENKSGGISRGFSVSVRPPGLDGKAADQEQPWKTWGGGVSQRLRLAAQIGLGRLISDRKGIQSCIEVWDEPDCHMSKDGILDLLQHLHDRARDEGRQIWVVTHTALDYPFDGEVLVEKGAAGSVVGSQ